MMPIAGTSRGKQTCEHSVNPSVGAMPKLEQGQEALPKAGTWLPR